MTISNVMYVEIYIWKSAEQYHWLVSISLDLCKPVFFHERTGV